jgi:protein involved in polysaccharide export with SLBB domain
MKKILLLLILVIILVAVDWFKFAHCQSVNDEEIIKKFSELAGRKTTGEGAYTSPEIYGEHPKTKLPEENTQTGSVTDAVEKGLNTLRPFGYDLFRSPSEMTPPSEVADLTDYILGPGDNIIIYLWGKVEKQYSLTVDRQGRVFIPQIGEIVVWGLTLDDFEAKLRKDFSRVYSDFKASISLGKIRSIRIYLTGEVRKPGAYTVSSLTTLFNALYIGGGPRERGSMRNIKLIRNNRVEAVVDLYQFLLRGDNASDVRLSSGDAVFIPVTGPRVSISGEIKRPGIYELIGGESIGRLLELAGGTTAEAYLDRIMLDRISPEDEREVVDLNLNPDNGPLDDIKLVDGDILTVFSIYEMKRNIVSIAGMVKHPGQFERTDSTTLKSIVTQGELLPENVYMERANLFRRYPDGRMDIIAVDLHEVTAGDTDIDLQDLDSIHVYSIDEVVREKHVFIEGEVKNPGRYKFYDNMTASDLIFLAGDLNKDAYLMHAELARTDSLGKVHLSGISLAGGQTREIPLQEDDRLFIRKKPDWFLHRMVAIEGEVKFPGQYALKSKNETLYGLLLRAGGFTESAFPKGIVFMRQTVSEDLKRQNLEEIIANSQPLEEDSLGNIKRMELVNYNPKQMNRIILDIEEIMATHGAEGDMILQNNDYIYIPEVPTGISVMGAVGANGTIRYAPKKNVRYYVERAGNFTKQAHKKETRLIKADGQVYSGGSILSKRVEMGDAVVVPVQIRKDRDWLKTISTTVSIIGGILTSAYIINRI